MAYNIVRQSDQNLFRGLSGCIWQAARIPIEEIRENPDRGAFFWDDFLQVAGGGAPTATQTVTILTGAQCYKFQGGPTTFGTCSPVASGASAGPSAISIPIGQLQMKALATAHDNCAIEPGDILSTPVGQFGVNATVGTLPKIAFEAKIKLDAADATQAMFIGLAEANLTSGQNTLFNNTEVLQNKSMIGLYTNATNVIQPVYGKNGTAFVNVGAGGTLVANTYTKLGFYLDPIDTVNWFIQWFQDGVSIGRQKTNLQASSAFPGGVALTPLLYVQNAGAGGVARLATIDWWACGELLDFS